MEPRRRETFTSLQLQRASDQLHEAIQSARQHRSLYSSSATSLSLLSASSDDEDDQGNQENHAFAANAVDTAKSIMTDESVSAEEKLRRFMRESLGPAARGNGASLTLTDLVESPLRPRRESRESASNIQLAGDKEEALFTRNEPSSHDVASLKRKLFEDDLVEKQARLALEVVQEQVETQARANRAMLEDLKRAIDRITAFVGHYGGMIMEDVGVHCSGPLSDVSMETLTEKWRAGLEQWKFQVEKAAQERMEELDQQTEERIRLLELAHQRERESLEAKILSLSDGVSTLSVELESLKTTNSLLVTTQDSAHIMHQECEEGLRMEIEDLRSYIVQHLRLVDSIPSAEQQQRHVLNLLSQLKQSELRELQWEMLFEEQSQATSQAQERVSMLLEDTARTQPLHQSSVPSKSVPLSPLESPRARRVSIASSGASSELQLYQQRIELLEDQLRDVKEQINCDHHQFLYEQQKWDLEKKTMSQDVEEVHSVSVKVLKLLLIREKLLKKQEKKLQRRLDKLRADEEIYRERYDALLSCLDTSMHECGVALLYVRQLAIASNPQSSVALPVKPIKFVRILKRMKTLQQDICSLLAAPHREP